MSLIKCYVKKKNYFYLLTLSEMPINIHDCNLTFDFGENAKNEDLLSQLTVSH